MKEWFSPQRCLKFLKKDVFENYRSILIVIGATTGALLLIFTIREVATVWGRFGFFARMDGTRAATSHLLYFVPILFFGGFAATSRSFSEIHTKGRSHDWLLLPASLPEKYLTRLVLTAFGWALGVLVYYFLFSLAAAGLVALISGRFLPLFNPFTARVWLYMAHYLVLQSVFLLGAVYFKRANFLKTVLVVTSFTIFLGLLTVATVRIVFGDIITQVMNTGRHFDGPELRELFARLRDLGQLLHTAAEIAYWALVAPLFWALGFLRLRETEVRNGV